MVQKPLIVVILHAGIYERSGFADGDQKIIILFAGP